MHLLAFTIGKEVYAVPIENINRIIEWSEPSRIGSNNDSVIGVIKESGNIVTLVSLGKLLNQEYDEDTKQIIIVNLGTTQRLGLVTNGNAHTLNVDDLSIAEIPSVLKQDGYIKNLIENNQQIIGLLNLEKIFDAIFIRGQDDEVLSLSVQNS